MYLIQRTTTAKFEILNFVFSFSKLKKISTACFHFSFISKYLKNSEKFPKWKYFLHNLLEIFHQFFKLFKFFFSKIINLIVFFFHKFSIVMENFHKSSIYVFFLDFSQSTNFFIMFISSW